MRLEDTAYDNSQTDCCARFDPVLWDDGEWHWNEKPFLKDHVRAFLHIPLNFGSVISRDLAAVEEAEAYPDQPLTLTQEVSLWGSEIFVALDREVPGATIEKLSGTFYSKAFEGPYRNAGKWAQAMEKYVEGKGKRIADLYYYYATCPKCAKHYGANHVVLFARVEAREPPLM